MQGINDPDTFELSEVVEKSSKTGIFTNSRLLMIKDGFLYYYSNVPDNYKTHQPNIMATLKEIPKSSIEIKSIQSISLQSAKSSCLIITFYGKDMIDRDDIRKSLSSKNYSHPVKPTSQNLEQWKFIFATVGKCRQWHSCLMKLKQHFSKVQHTFDKFTEYMANFDPEIRSSLPQSANNNNIDYLNRISSPTKAGSQKGGKNAAAVAVAPTVSFTQKYRRDKDTGIFQIQQMAQEQQDVTPKANQRNITTKSNQRLNAELKDIIKINQQTIQQTQNGQEKTRELSMSSILKQQDIQMQSYLEDNQKGTSNKSNSRVQFQSSQIDQDKLNQTQNHKEMSNSKMPDIQKQKEPKKQQQNQMQKQKMYQIIQRIRKQQREKADQQKRILSQQLLQKQNQLNRMSYQLQSNRKIQHLLQQRVLEQQRKRQQEQKTKLMLLKEKRQEEQYKRLRYSLDIQTTLHQNDPKIIQIRQESIQTQTFKDIIDVIEGGLQLSNDRNSRYSEGNESTLNNLNEKNSISLFRNTLSYISQVKLESTADIQSYDYYWQIGQIYKSTDLKDRISKELALAEFTRKASRKVVEIVTSYIDEKKPKQPVSVDRHIFEIQIVCSRGKIIRTEGSQRLLYANQAHQNLKRTYKIYNHLNETIISILKKKHSYPLRVPFCCLVQYKGYTALARIMPTLKPKSVNVHLIRALGLNIPIYNLSLKDFQSHNAVCSMITSSIAYKSTKEDEPSIFRGAAKFINFIQQNRRANLSICSQKLYEECKQIENSQEQRTQLAETITFCRYFKKLMKANTPFADPLDQSQFIDEFMRDPIPTLKQHFSDSKNHRVSGLMLYYMQKIIGIRVNGKFNQQQPQYSILPVTRQYGLHNLDVSQFALNFQKYCLQKKYELASKALNYSKYLTQDYSQILMNQAYLHIHQHQYYYALQKLQLGMQMLSQHNPRRLKALQMQAQCLQASGQQIQSMESLKALLQLTEYVYGNDSLVEVYFLIADSLNRQRLIPQLIQVYRKILNDSPKYRQRVLLKFSQSLLSEQEMDPHVLLDFVSKQLKQQIEKEQPLVQRLLGQLYLRVKNKSKAQSYFNSAFNKFLTEGNSFNNICQTFTRCFQCCSSIQQRKSLHRQIYTKLSQTDFISSPYCKIINSLTVQAICEAYTAKELENIICFLQEDKWKASSIRLLQWTWLDGVLRCVAQGQYISTEERNNLLSNIEPTQLSQFCMILNNRNNAS